ncbi:MAG: hypothetical protein ABIO55_05245 [Ginsengibacter sp.]
MKKKILFITPVLFIAILVNAQEATNYRGAFAPAPVRMWTESWVNWDPKNTAYPSTDSTINTNITSSRTLSPAHTYLLQGLIHITDGVTLTVLPGTVIRGQFNPATASGIVVQRGAKLDAEGTVCNPIVFTSNRTVAEGRAQGDWAGIILLGKAPNNQGLNVPVEGITQTDANATFGGTDENDNSGILKYVRIEFPGFVFSPNNEINGLTLGSVGNGTQIDYVQVSYSNDDSYEWFGGSVNCQHLIAYRGLDDDFDTDFGYHGLVQYGLGVKDPDISDDPNVSTSEGFESDNEGSGTTEGFYPKTSASFYNITQIGAFRCTGNNGTGTTPNATGFRRGARIRRNSDLKIVNSILMNNWRGFQIVINPASDPFTLGNFNQDSARFRNNIIAADFVTAATGSTYGALAGKLFAAEDNPVGAATTFGTRAVLNTPAYGNDSINTCSLLTNAWSFTNPDYRPNSGFTDANFPNGNPATDGAKLSNAPNLSVALQITGGSLFTSGQTKNFKAIVISDATATTAGIVTLSIAKPSAWDLTVQGITTLSTDPLNPTPGVSTSGNTNANWNFYLSGTTIIAVSKPGVVIPKSTNLQLGFTATRPVTTPTGTNQTLVASVSGGGDATPFNNTAASGLSAN